jgi:hypothetical protein
MAGLVVHQNAPRSAQDSKSLWLEGTIGTGEGPILVVSCEDFVLHKDPGEEFTFVLGMCFPYKVWLESSVASLELYEVCRAGGVYAIRRPHPGNRVLYSWL